MGNNLPASGRLSYTIAATGLCVWLLQRRGRDHRTGPAHRCQTHHSLGRSQVDWLSPSAVSSRDDPAILRGKPRHAEIFGGGRDAVKTGLGELRTGIRCLDDFTARIVAVIDRVRHNAIGQPAFMSEVPARLRSHGFSLPFSDVLSLQIDGESDAIAIECGKESLVPVPQFEVAFFGVKWYGTVQFYDSSVETVHNVLGDEHRGGETDTRMVRLRGIVVRDQCYGTTEPRIVVVRT